MGCDGAPMSVRVKHGSYTVPKSKMIFKRSKVFKHFNSGRSRGWEDLPPPPFIFRPKSKCQDTLCAFYCDYSGIGIFGIDGICVLLGAIPFSE